jgi:hypothetical protein
MSKELDRCIEVRIIDENGKRVEGAKLTFYGNDHVLAVIPYTRDKNPTLQITDWSMIVKIEVLYGGFAQTDTLAQNQCEWIFTIPSEFLPKPKPTVFIGCSVEGLTEARFIQKELRHVASPVIWHQGVFGLSRSTLETLVEKAPSFNYAILVLTPDDMLLKRADEVKSARDNVLFELGLFMGALGRMRTFIVAEKSVQLPTDLAGITTVNFVRGEGFSREANMGSVATTLLDEMGLNH